MSRVERVAPLRLDLQPYEARLILLTDSATQRGKAQLTVVARAKSIDLATDWKVTFGEPGQSIPMTTLHSWSDEPGLKYYSGEASYLKAFELPASDLMAGIKAVLDFGEGTPIQEPTTLPQFNMRAYLEGPVREAAEVYVNGELAGFVWHPPYTLDVTRFLKVGENVLRIVVGNTAINSMAGRVLPSYRLLNQRYGERFVPQDMGNLESLPSGILGGVRLELERMSEASQ